MAHFSFEGLTLAFFDSTRLFVGLCLLLNFELYSTVCNSFCPQTSAADLEKKLMGMYLG